MHMWYLSSPFASSFHTVEVCSRLSKPIVQSLDSTQSNGQSASIAEDEEAKRFSQQQQEVLLAYQKAVAERDAALQSLQLRVIELERQLASAQQTGSSPKDAFSTGGANHFFLT